MTAPLSHPLSAKPATGDWMQDRLTEARGVLADCTQHPDTLVILAARVVVGQTGDADECADALSNLKKDQLQKLLRLGRSVTAEAGHIVALQGQHITDFVILVDGHCHIEKNGFHIASATRGTLLENLPFAHSVVALATVRTVSPSRLFLIDRAPLQAFLRRNPDAMVDIERCIAVDVGIKLAETTERLSAHLESDTV